MLYNTEVLKRILTFILKYLVSRNRKKNRYSFDDELKPRFQMNFNEHGNKLKGGYHIIASAV